MAAEFVSDYPTFSLLDGLVVEGDAATGSLFDGGGGFEGDSNDLFKPSNTSVSFEIDDAVFELDSYLEDHVPLPPEGETAAAKSDFILTSLLSTTATTSPSIIKSSLSDDSGSPQSLSSLDGPSEHDQYACSKNCAGGGGGGGGGRKPFAKKEKKRLQNRRAATKYREKRKSKEDDLTQKKEELERMNTELRGKEERLLCEINLVKELLERIKPSSGNLN